MPHATRLETELLGRPRIPGSSVYLLAGLFGAALLWAHLVQVDMAVRAPGVVRPEGEPVRMASEVGGIVAEVLVSEGDWLRSGDPLLRLEDTEFRAQRKTLERQTSLVRRSLQDVGRHVENRTAVYRMEVSKLDAEIQAAREERDRRLAERDAMQRRAEIRVARARAEYETSRSMVAAGLVSRQSHDRVSSELELAEAEDRELRAREPGDASLRALLRSADVLRAVFESDRRNLLDETIPLASELERLEAERAQAALRIRRGTVQSPANGRITFMSPVHPGEYIAPGTLVATIVPDGSGVLVEALISNQEVENVRAGQSARLIGADSLRIDGRVLSVGPDAIFDESAAGAYRVRIVPETPDLRLGMALDVRLITDRESLLGLLARRISGSFRDWAGS